MLGTCLPGEGWKGVRLGGWGFWKGQKKGVLVPCSLWDGLSQVAFVCQPPRTNKSSTRLKPGWLMASWEKRYATMFIFPVQSFLFKSLYRPRACCLKSWRCSPTIHSKPRRPAALSFSADFRALGWAQESDLQATVGSSGVRCCSRAG